MHNKNVYFLCKITIEISTSMTYNNKRNIDKQIKKGENNMKKTILINGEPKEGFTWECERVVVLENEKRYSADLTTYCKSWKTAVKRFMKNLPDIKELEGWGECIYESCENGYFVIDEKNEFRFEVEEQHEGLWYVYLIVFKEQNEIDTTEYVMIKNKKVKKVIGMFEKECFEKKGWDDLHESIKNLDATVKETKHKLKTFVNEIKDVQWQRHVDDNEYEIVYQLSEDLDEYKLELQFLKCYLSDYEKHYHFKYVYSDSLEYLVHKGFTYDGKHFFWCEEDVCYYDDETEETRFEEEYTPQYCIWD